MCAAGMAYSRDVRWDRFFEDLEGQLTSEWEAERAALESEAERLRLSRVDLRSRLVALAGRGAAQVVLELADGSAQDAHLTAVGADWFAASPGARDAVQLLVPLSAVCSIGADHGELLSSARPDVAGSRLAERVTFGFAMRDLARRRVAMTLQLCSGRSLTGTVDRVGADHLDLALHDSGAARRAADVAGFRLVPLAAVAWARIDSTVGIPLV